MNRWLARFSVSFVIFAGLLMYQGWREMRAPGMGWSWRVGMYFLAAGICAALALRGVHERHKHEYSQSPPEDGEKKE